MKRKPPGKAYASMSKLESEAVRAALSRDWFLRRGMDVPPDHGLDLPERVMMASSAKYEREMVRKALEAKGQK